MRLASRFTLPAALLVAITTSLPGAAQNLLENPSFDNDNAGWIEAPYTVEFFYREDVGSTLVGGSGPGAIRIEFSYWNGGSNGVYQEVPVTGGESYTAALSVYVPSVDNPALATPLIVGWFDGSHHHLYSDYLYPDNPAPDQWTRISSHVVAPVNAVYAWFVAAITNPNDSAETRPGLSYVDDAVFAARGTGTTTQEIFIPAAASAHGEEGTFWTTSGWLHNAADDPADVYGAFLEKKKNNAAAVASPIFLATIPAHGTVELDDLVSALGSPEKTGGLYLRAEAADAGAPLPFLHVTSYTSTPNTAGPGAYGQGIPAVGSHRVVTTIAPGVFQSEQRRTNVGVLNTSADWIELSITILNATNTITTTTSWLLAPYEQRQTGLTGFGISSMEGGAVVFTQTSANGSYCAYLSVVDQNTGDAVYVPAQ